VSLKLSELKGDADVELLDKNGSRIKSSLLSGSSTENIYSILESGDYYARVFPGVKNASTNYSLSLKVTNLSNVVRLGSENVNIWQYNTNGRSDEGIDPNRETVVVIHGWKNSDNSSSIQALAKQVASKSNLQVLALDWGSIAEKANLDWGAVPFETAKWVGHVASWAKECLVNLGLSKNNLTLVGHSLGAYVSAEIGQLLGKVKSIIALDPAFPANNYDIYGNEPGDQRPKKFSDVADKSTAFVASDERGGLAGDNSMASSANDSFIVHFNDDRAIQITDDEYHGGVTQVFTSLLAQQTFSLSNYERDRFDNRGQVSDKPKDENHEGVIFANKVNETWQANKFTYVSGSNRTTWL
jgi:pimeloyl-ACP methyl ester carboxylesterase